MNRSRNTRPLAFGLLAVLVTAHGDESVSMFDQQTYRPLVADQKAFYVGDVLTVVIQEVATASSSADLRARRTFSVAASASSADSAPHSASANTATTSNGVGTTDRTGRLLAQLTVRVTGVEPSGDLLVSGRQSLKINGEEQRIVLSGLVRRRDVADDNTVLSSRIADARIEFDGRGFVTDQGRPGWLARLFTLLGL
jgi:flagellar L-ring protein precursor FlgH